MRNNTNLNAKNNSNVAHNWAHATGNVMKGSNFYYDNDGVIYSYGPHAPIAINVDNHVYLMTLQRWGNATAKHINYVNRSIPTNATVVHMHTLPINNIPNHDANISYWLGQLITAKKVYLNASVKTKQIHLINSIIAQLDAYKFHFEIDPCAMSSELLSFYTWYTGIDIQTILAEEAVKTKERDAKKQAKQDRLKYEAVAMFHNFEIASLPYDPANATLLRYNVKTGNVETSKGIRIPRDIAIRLYNTIMAKVHNGGCDNCNVAVFGSYTIDTISDSHIVAGCHNIRLSEVYNCYQSMTKQDA